MKPLKALNLQVTPHKAAYGGDLKPVVSLKYMQQKRRK